MEKKIGRPRKKTYDPITVMKELLARGMQHFKETSGLSLEKVKKLANKRSA